LDDEQACQLPASRRHSKSDPLSEDEKENVADFAPVEDFGPEVIVVLGATVSTFHVRCAGEASFVPAESFARTLNVCDPCGRPVYVFSDAHDAQSRPSSLHWKVAAVSGEENLKVAEVEDVGPLGPAAMLVSGGRSIRHDQLAGEASTFPARSFARARMTCFPSESPLT
jgi:hypothetical protein